MRTGNIGIERLQLRGPGITHENLKCKKQNKPDDMLVGRAVKRLGPSSRTFSAVAHKPISYDDFVELHSRGLSLQERLSEQLPSIAQGLKEEGYCVIDGLLGDQMCKLMREEAAGMYQRGDFERSYSEVQETGERIWRKNVMAAEFNPDSWMYSPRLIIYTSEVLPLTTTWSLGHHCVVSQILGAVPALLAPLFPQLKLNNVVHGHKLAVVTNHPSATLRLSSCY